jgi:two-component system, NarL family, nitrate/nitrite response regulator NarL
MEKYFDACRSNCQRKSRSQIDWQKKEKFLRKICCLAAYRLRLVTHCLGLDRVGGLTAGVDGGNATRSQSFLSPCHERTSGKIPRSHRMPITLLLVDAQELFREGLRALIQKEPGYSLLGEARTGEEAVLLAPQLSPDVILMDLAMPDVNGLGALARIHAHCPRSQIIAVSCCIDEHIVRRVLTIGAAAHITKLQSFRELRSAINAVHARQSGPCQIPSLPLTDESARPKNGQLSPRERETLRLMTQGRSSQDIARQLQVCLKTVEAHRHNLRQKLGLSSMADIIRYAIQQEGASADRPRTAPQAALRGLPNACVIRHRAVMTIQSDASLHLVTRITHQAVHSDGVQ